MTGQAPPAISIFVTFLRVLTIVGACLFGSSALAAEIRADPSRSAGAILEGTIVPGDFEKVRRYFGSGDLITDQIYLASPGGDVAEAMKIGRLLRTLKITTAVPGRGPVLEIKKVAEIRGVKDFNADYMCASSCFFAFAAGIFREVDLSETPVLGIHRPYLSATDLRGMQADQAVAAAADAKAIVADYLREMSVPSKYLDRMFSVPKDDIQWISNEDFEADFKGFMPSLRDWADAKCGTLTADEKKIWNGLKYKTDLTPAETIMGKALLKKRFTQEDCQRELRSDLTFEAWGWALAKGLFSQSK